MTQGLNATPSTIAQLNDRFRRQGVTGPIPGRALATAGIAALPLDTQLLLWAAVAQFQDFTQDNDPYGEHDFGALVFPAVGRVFWKIDYYADARMEWGSDAPEDPARSFRVLTLMLASEY